NLQLLLEEASEEPDEARRAELLARIRATVTRATERLGDRSRAGQRPQPSEGLVDLADALDELRERLRPTLLATRAELEIQCPRGLAVRGDAHALRTAVENVAANALEALQANGPGGRLALRAQQRNGAVELVVQDDGPGIPGDLKTRLFSPFSSGHNGTGLGLAI